MSVSRNIGFIERFYFKIIRIKFHVVSLFITDTTTTTNLTNLNLCTLLSTTINKCTIYCYFIIPFITCLYFFQFFFAVS